MVVVKIIELIGSSEEDWEDAIQEAVKEASKTVKNIVGIDVRSIKADIRNNKITRYKAHCKIAFTVER